MKLSSISRSSRLIRWVIGIKIGCSVRFGAPYHWSVPPGHEKAREAPCFQGLSCAPFPGCQGKGGNPWGHPHLVPVIAAPSGRCRHVEPSGILGRWSARSAAPNSGRLSICVGRHQSYGDAPLGLGPVRQRLPHLLARSLYAFGPSKTRNQSRMANFNRSTSSSAKTPQWAMVPRSMLSPDRTRPTAD